MNENEKKPENPSAFLYVFPADEKKGLVAEAVEGATLRDYFANSAMQSHLNNFDLYKGVAKAYNCNSDKSIYNAIAKEAYQIADAMLKQRGL
jgi:hypothetical protein